MSLVGQAAFVTAQRADSRVFDLRKFGVVPGQLATQHARIQAAVDEVNALGGGILVAPHGDIYTEAQINWKSGVHLVGAGRRATVFKPQGSGFAVIHHRVGEGDGTGGEFIEDVSFQDFEIDGTGYTDEDHHIGAKGIFFWYARRALFRNLYVHHTVGTGLGVDFLVDTHFEYCVTNNCGRLFNAADGDTGGAGIGIGTGGSDLEPVSISNCYAYDNGNYGFFFETQRLDDPPGIVSKGFRVTGCFAKGNRIGFGNKGSGPITYVACEARENTTDGFGLQGESYEDILVGCRAEGNGRNGVFIDADCRGKVIISASRINENGLEGIRRATPAAGNNGGSLTIVGSEVSRNQRNGVYVQGGSLHIADSHIQDNGQELVSGQRYGVYIAASLAHVNIHDNRITDTQDSVTQSAAIRIPGGVSPAAGTVHDNDFTGNTTAISLAGSLGELHLHNNRGYNPVGAANHSAGASPYTYTAGNTPETLFIKGSSLSAKKGSQELGTGQSFYVIDLHPRESVEVTYTSINSWIVDKR